MSAAKLFLNDDDAPNSLKQKLTQIFDENIKDKGALLCGVKRATRGRLCDVIKESSGAWKILANALANLETALW